MLSQPGKQTFAMHILPNISGSKNNQLWNLISQYNITWENFLLKNNTQNMVEKSHPDFSLKNQN